MNVIFGTGALGMAVMRELVREKKQVRMVNRKSNVPLPSGVELVHGDAGDESFCKEVCQDAEVIFNCTGLPYDQWASGLPKIQHGIMEGAASSRAKLIYADNLYAYGPHAGPYHEGLPERPVGKKTEVRARLGQMVLQAHREGRVQAAIGRGASFYGPGVRLATLGERVFKPALAGKPAEAIGDIDQPHTHIYIEDFARGLITLAKNEEALGQIWHIPADQTVTTRELIDMIYREAGHKPKYRVANGFLLSVMGWFNPMVREFKEMLYMLNRPFIVDHQKYERTFGLQITPHSEAIKRTMEWYRNLDQE